MTLIQPTTAFEQYVGNPAEVYQQHFVPVIAAPFARRLLTAVQLQAGERVLDVACGTGVVARLAAEQVGSSGAVVGLDSHPGMLAVARSIPATGAAIDWDQANAEQMDLADESVDVALCSLGIQFFADQVGALVEMRRVLVPGGRLGLATPGPTPALFTELGTVLGQHLGAEVAGFVPVVFSMFDPTGVTDLLGLAGFTGLDVQYAPVRLTLPPPADFLWLYLKSTPLADMVAHLGPAARTALEQDVVAVWQPFVAAGGGLSMEVGLLNATARR